MNWKHFKQFFIFLSPLKLGKRKKWAIYTVVGWLWPDGLASCRVSLSHRVAPQRQINQTRMSFRGASTKRISGRCLDILLCPRTKQHRKITSALFGLITHVFAGCRVFFLDSFLPKCSRRRCCIFHLKLPALSRYLICCRQHKNKNSSNISCVYTAEDWVDWMESVKNYIHTLENGAR